MNEQPVPRSDEERSLQRFRPYRNGEVRFNTKGAYVRYADYERLQRAVSHLFSHWDQVSQTLEPCGTTFSELRQAMFEFRDWRQAFDHREPIPGVCTCYGFEGDNNDCSRHGGHAFPTNDAAMIRDNGDAR